MNTFSTDIGVKSSSKIKKMKLISFATKLLHYLPSELSHFIALNGLKIFYKLGILKYFVSNQVSSKNDANNLSNLQEKLKMPKLSNRLGFAAGLDKNGEFIDCLASLGVGFIEVGTVTPRPQKGNTKPRIFRNRKEKSILNRLGFNNKGVDKLVKRLKTRRTNIVIGVSLGKNFDTPNELAYKDYLECMEKVYEFSDYLAVNISSPNTKGLRALSEKAVLGKLLIEIKNKQRSLADSFGYKPIFIKLSPDEDSRGMKDICELIQEHNIDGIISTNTTIQHEDKKGRGGISGSPLFKLSTEKLIEARKLIGSDMPIIASGGVMNAQDFYEKISSGADLVQIYSGFIFEGPKLVNEVLNTN